MADPHHVPALDAHDARTVALYRAGLGLCAIGVGSLALAPWIGAAVGVPTVLLGVLVAIVDLHLYDKRIRWVIQAAGALGAWLVAVGALAERSLVGDVGLGFLFVAISALALKERFCFRIPGLGLVPLLLAASLVPRVVGAPRVASVLLALAALPLVALVVAKLRQPMHYDIGDRSRYQV